MKTILVAVALMLASTAAWAACVTNVIVDSEGRHIVCVTCCYPNGTCTTTCN